jgi:hypothetical protein
MSKVFVLIAFFIVYSHCALPQSSSQKSDVALVNPSKKSQPTLARQRAHIEGYALSKRKRIVNKALGIIGIILGSAVALAVVYVGLAVLAFTGTNCW